tara:strand:- start:6519 stop:8621 length:2103 start_codon:yes stop_codon:yes gene_type:complete
MAENPEKMTEDQLRSQVQSEFEEGMGREGGDISAERAEAYSFYLAKQFDKVEEGESSFVTASVEEVIDGIMPNLLRMFTSADNLVNFDPSAMDDEQQAEQESDYVNYVFFKQNDAFLILYTWFFTALVQKNGIVKAFWDDSERISEESYEHLTGPELAELMEDDELEALEQVEKVIELPSPDGMGMVEVPVHDVRFRRVTTKGQVKVVGVPPESWRISSDCQSVNPEGARFTGEEREITRTELIDMGFDKKLVYELPSTDDVIEGGEEAERRDKSDEQQTTIPADKSQELVYVQEAYLRVDFDGDGRSEMRHILVAGSKVLTNDVVDRHPYHVICPQPLPFKHFGRSTAEKVIQNQRLESTLVRQILNNLYHSNRPGTAVWEQGMTENTLDDLLSVRAGRVARFARPVQESMAPLTVPYTAGSTFPMLQWLSQEKKERTGISIDAQGMDIDSLKHVQKSVMDDATDIGRMKIEAIARIFAETGLKTLFLHIHELVQKHQDIEAIIKLRNQWVPIDPTSWRTRYDMTVNIGLGIGTREQNRMHLDAIANIQKQIMEAGGFGSLVTPMNVYNMASEFVKNANFKSPELFFTKTDKVDVPSDEEAKLQQQQQQLQQRQQQLDAERQQIAAAKMKLDAQKAQFEVQRAQADLGLQAEELERKRQEDKNDLMVAMGKNDIAMEKIQNDLVEIDAKYGGNTSGVQK